ncbi:MAG: ROK family protein [Candidatus Anammoximicrobium sp.]|nr:ROK family protein [Candidatus Anammoximicrobium sp.]
MYLGVEIGGTKLQLGVGDGLSDQLAAWERLDIDARRGAAAILEQIERAAAGLLRRFPVSRVGIGFGGPVDTAAGRVIVSHQVDGWCDFPLAAWCQETLGLPAVLGNDCDSAALAEARHGAGRGRQTVLYVTVGTGIGGGLVQGGVLHGKGRPASAEIGHLRPGLQADRPEATVESLASGLGIAAAARARLAAQVALPSGPESRCGNNGCGRDGDHSATAERGEEGYRRDLLERVGGDADRVTAKVLGQAASQGNQLAAEILERSCQVLGWALAQAITLLAPEVVVVGGGVSLLGEALFFAPVRQAVRRYVFPPLADSYQILPAALGELVVVHGAIALAAESRGSDGPGDWRKTDRGEQESRSRIA